MKNFILLLFFAFQMPLFSQSELVSKLKNVSKDKNPASSIENKLILFAISSDDNKLFNEQFEKTISTYKVAKLKGGFNGVAGFIVVKTTNEKIAIEKSGVKNALVILESELSETVSPEIKNIVFNSNGEIIYQNLNQDNLFKSIHQLITR